MTSTSKISRMISSSGKLSPSAMISKKVTSKKIVYPDELIKLKKAPTPSLFEGYILYSELFGNIRILYDSNNHAEAYAAPYHGKIYVSRKFFDLGQSERRYVLRHELGHFFETLKVFDGNPSFFWRINDSGIFGKGVITKGGDKYFEGCFATFALKESVAECFAVYTSPTPNELKKRYPEAYRFVDEHYKKILLGA
jgi:hypothetical protein